MSPAAGRLGSRPRTICAESRSVLSLVHPEDVPRVAPALQRMLAGEMMRAFEVPDGSRGRRGMRWFSQTNVPLRDEQGVIVGMQGIAHDITQRREMQARVAQAERLADLGRMGASIAHEIRNPLGAIVNSISVLRRRALPRIRAC